ncbi:hypothetical protein M413DRAFT_225556 [Hebeloma cylindrosporum]|uniref:Uncharacterized protein n=1 Tax=Hebeloma cylindrosporum TaxID=76867 RepID=A0A0C3CWL7_HEBCY|nr:hypothetical protein M413DRAFT_225556 [Hebeloma cylindrosporum h7]
MLPQLRPLVIIALNSCMRHLSVILVTIIRGSAPEWTSTITAQPDTTLSTPIVLPTTDANGVNILTTPPLVTIMSTSSETNGAFTIVTHIVANPPVGGEQFTSKPTILQNQGAVAGIFVAVGIIAASIIAGLIYCFKRNQRIARRNRWLAGLQQRQPSRSLSEDPFQDPNDGQMDTGTAPVMRSLNSGNHGFQWDRMESGPLLEKSVNPSSGHAANQHLQRPDIHPMPTPANPGLSDADVDRNAYSTDPPTTNIPRYRHSMTPSTPSIYPSILPLQGDNFHEAADGFPSVTQRPEDVVTVPPRPPRSHLRESAKKLDPSPITPSGSTSSHTNTNSSSLLSEPRPQDVLSRRTILDPQTRSTSP